VLAKGINMDRKQRGQLRLTHKQIARLWLLGIALAILVLIVACLALPGSAKP
jgi:hypothetical protein